MQQHRAVLARWSCSLRTSACALLVLAACANSAAALPCVGDCGHDGAVTVEELVIGVNIALGIAQIEACEPFDTDDSHTVTVEELIKGVNAALNSCVDAPTPTATEHSTAVTATPTESPTPTATCAPTGTPYYSDHCQPCPTIREGCYASACGLCILVTATPTPTGPTPSPTCSQIVFQFCPDGVTTCGGGVCCRCEATNTPTRTVSATLTFMTTITATGTPTSTRTVTRTNTPTITLTPANTLTATRTPTGSPSVAPTVIGSCDDFDECTVMDTCQAGGMCKGTPKDNGTACDDHDPCTLSDHCQAGHCVGGTTAQDGTACTFPGLDLCILSAQCQFGFCLPQLKSCPDSGNKCTPNVCNPLNGQCTQFPTDCDSNCTTAQCDPSTGDCINEQNKASTTACDDGNACTSNDHCQTGQCVGTASTVPPTATHPTATATATRSASPIPSSTPTLLFGVTATPSRTPTRTTTPTATTMGAGSVARRAGAAIDSTSSALLVLPNVVSALLGHLPMAGAGAAAISLGPIPFTCPGGNGGQISCSQSFNPPTFGPPSYEITLTNCVVSGTGGATITIDGAITLLGQPGDLCLLDVPTDASITIHSLTITTQTPAGSTEATFTDIGGTLSLSGFDNDCRYDDLTLALTGSIGVVTKDALGEPIAATTAMFEGGSSIEIAVDTYGAQCVPTKYTTTVNGGIMFSSGGTSFDAVFDSYTLTDDASSGTNMIEISGNLTSACFGGTVTFSTPTALALVSTAACPTGGTVNVSFGDATDAVIYTSPGGVNIDLGDNGTIDHMFQSCVELVAALCPAS